MASGPMPTPGSREAHRDACNLSCGVSKCAISTVNNGVVAFRMDARPLAMWCCPQTTSAKGDRVLEEPHAEEGGPDRIFESPADRAKTRSGICK